jgi:hypothetical protein
MQESREIIRFNFFFFFGNARYVSRHDVRKGEDGMFVAEAIHKSLDDLFRKRGRTQSSAQSLEIKLLLESYTESI